MTPFIPLVFVALNHAVQMRQYYRSPDGITIERPDESMYFEYLIIAEIAGLVLLLVALEFIFRKLYRKMVCLGRRLKF